MARTSAHSRQRIIDHGEVFTPEKLVNDMLDLVAHECERIDSRFLEPACGNGNFLAEVLRRKLKTVTWKQAKNRDKCERDAVIATCSIYGIDLLADNVQECRDRLLRIIEEAHQTQFKCVLPEPAKRALVFILGKNIVQGDALTMKTGTGQPITFSEWSAVNGTQVKRRDFTFDHLLEHADMTKEGSLFGTLEEKDYAPAPVADFPLSHYLHLPEAEDAQ